MPNSSLSQQVLTLKNKGKSFLACIRFIQKTQGISLKAAYDLSLILAAFTNKEKETMRHSVQRMQSEFDENQ